MASGFENAPISRTICIFVFLISVLFGDLNDKNKSGGKYLTLDLVKLTKGELWRFFLSPLCFQSLPQLAVGIILMYTFRQFERQLGNRKFGSLLLVSFAISQLILFAVIVLAFSGGYHLIPTSGPFFFIFAMIPLFFKYIPRLHPLKISLGGVVFSEKSWTYLLALQLALSDGYPSIVSSIAGWIAGYVYCIEGLGLQEYRSPRILETVFVSSHNLLSGFFQFPGIQAANPRTQNQAAGPPQRQRLAQQGIPQGGPGDGFGDGNGFSRYGAGMPPAQPPNEDLVTSLTNLGFDRAAAIRALALTGNNLEMAANVLLQDS